MREGLHKIVSAEETIVAIATPLGRSGIGIVRMSGRDALAIADRFFKSSVGVEHRHATVGVWVDAAGQMVDEVIVTYFRTPQSYTGEDIVEISAHGNPLIHHRIIECARSAGARIATPGEFTLRAVAHGKMDLIQAEAVREFIEAQTEQQARTALRQMEGANSKRIRPIKDQLIHIVAQIEAGIDFAEDDVQIPDGSTIAVRVRPLTAQLESLQETFGYGRMLIQGLHLAILGKPNVGKSSLFNRMVSADRAIVTDIPGTTRDVVTETVHMDGVPLRFSDTAGIRETSDHVESVGVTKTMETLYGADLALVVLDGSSALDDNDHVVLNRTSAISHLIVINKCDLTEAIPPGSFNQTRALRVSAKTGEGLLELGEAIRRFVFDRKTDVSDDFVLTSGRQNEAILKAISALRAGSDAIERRVPHEMVLLDFYEAISALDEMTGEVVTDDILDRIFSTFCIGK